MARRLVWEYMKQEGEPRSQEALKAMMREAERLAGRGKGKGAGKERFQ